MPLSLARSILTQGLAARPGTEVARASGSFTYITAPSWTKPMRIVVVPSAWAACGICEKSIAIDIDAA